MDLKEKLEQRRKEREAEAASLAMKELVAKVDFAKSSKAKKLILTTEALNVLSHMASTCCDLPQSLSQEEADRIIDAAANQAVAWWGRTVIIFGVLLSIYLALDNAVSHSIAHPWVLSFVTALFSIIFGLLLNYGLASQKKEEMLKHITSK